MPLIKKYLSHEKYVRSHCSTFKFNIIFNPKYLCFPHLSGIDQFLLNPLAAITEEWIKFLMKSNFLSKRDEFSRGYESLGLIENCW